ncbi:MAG: hypothetical protein PHT82_00430 [Candidatus Portnoybacteria bacterium]|jgi:hypothetical protein|nr:hypothetical protein [Candidatus Portnoybacteria bacterium]MDD5751993.1 hypothetical protein [Candidatus Portnoybacteria bacterium]HNU96983.1 hypothetical protein [Candidatus Portnoybacteria bacterium]
MENFQFKQINTQINPAFQPKVELKEKGIKKFFNKRNLPKTSAILIGIGILIIVGAILWGRSSFLSSNVNISIESPNDIASGEEIELIVHYDNGNRVDLNEANLIVTYPEGAFSSNGEEIYQDSKTIGIIEGKKQGEVIFKVRLLGEKGSAKNIVAKLIYKPENISSKFESNTSTKIEINVISIGIHIEGSEKAVAGQEVNYAIEYENKTDKTINDLKIKLEYPDDFIFKNSEPVPTSENDTSIWEINTLKANEKKTINLVGVLNGQEMENKILKGTIGKNEGNNFLQYSQSEFVTQISQAPIILDVGIDNFSKENCVIDAGQNLKYTIKFKNNTDIALRELILKAHIENNGIFNVEDIELNKKGFFDSRNNVIVWSGADIPTLNLLETGQSGEVGFSIQIRNRLPIYSFNDKNFKANIIAEIQTLTVPAKFAGTELKFEKELSCKINTQMSLATKVYYHDTYQGIYNSGPIPPKVNSTTQYTVHWQITNTSNDLNNVIVKSVLPQGIEWTGNVINKSDKGQIFYNERTKEIVWNVGKVSAGAGVTMSVYEIIFQIALTPSINQVGAMPTLINESQIEGKDLFTGTILTKTASAVNTSIPDDFKIGDSGEKVIQ